MVNNPFDNHKLQFSPLSLKKSVLHRHDPSSNIAAQYGPYTPNPLCD